MYQGIFTMLVGIPGSGKTTYANTLYERRAVYDSVVLKRETQVILSSDAIREEIYGTEGDQRNNNEVFEIMFNRTKQALREDKKVIYDATNLSSKKRTNLIKRLKEDPYIRHNVKFICNMLVADVEKCIERDLRRERTVGRSVIERMYKGLQVPMYMEGWDEIYYKLVDRGFGTINVGPRMIYTYDNYVNYILKSTKAGKECIDLAQDSSYHSFSVSRHMFYAFDRVRVYSEDNNLLLATMLHDIGKPYCKNFKEGSRYANFIGHENVSAYQTVGILLETGLSEEDITEVSTYVQLHMRFMNPESYKAKEKLYNGLGEKMFKNLEYLHNGDISAK